MIDFPSPPHFGALAIRSGRAVRANDELAKLCPAAAAAIAAGKGWPGVLGLDQPDAAQAWWESTNGAERPGAFVAAAEGGKRWLRLRAHRDPDAKDAAEAVISVEDVTEEQAAFQKVRLEAEHFHALIERSSEGISLFDTQGRILYEAPSNKRIHGYEATEMEGRTLISFCHPDDAERIGLRFQHLAEAPGVVVTEIVRFRHKQGHYIYLEGTVLNATDEPRLRALVNNFREVTGRLEAERELRRAKSAAEEAHRLQQHFLTNLTHEFRTPLTLIRGPLEIVAADAATSERSRQTLGLVFRNIDRLDALLTELVDLARLDAGAFVLKVNQHDLGAFIRRHVESFEGAAREKSISFQLELPEACWVFFDAPKLAKVLVNLVGNALKFSPPQTKIRVSLQVRADADGEGNVQVAVSDQGPGMDEATRTRVFERFYQGDAGLARGHEGMGIGMAIAREMVEMHGGSLTVDSAPGKGSTFTFTLPLGCEHLDPDNIDTAEVPEPRPHSVGARAPLPRVAATDGSDGSAARPVLLLVEDNLDMRAYLRMHLDLHYRVREAENGRVALDALAEAVPDVILSDVMMPQVSGLELCRRIKANPQWRAVPVILLSAKGAVDNRVEGLEAGADDYMAKPFSVAELLQRLKVRLPQRPAPEGGSAGEEWAAKLCTCVDENLGEADFDVEAMAQRIGYSSRQLRRRTLEQLGVTPAALLLSRRLQRARELIEGKRHETMAEVAHAVGLSPGYFSRRYRQAYRCEEIRM